jgi:uncharacterized protein Usg
MKLTTLFLLIITIASLLIIGCGLTVITVLHGIDIPPHNSQPYVEQKLNNNPEFISVCTYELWKNTTHSVLLTSRDGSQYMENVSNLYNVCYFRDKHSKVTFVGTARNWWDAQLYAELRDSAAYVRDI